MKSCEWSLRMSLFSRHLRWDTTALSQCACAKKLYYRHDLESISCDPSQPKPWIDQAHDHVWASVQALCKTSEETQLTVNDEQLASQAHIVCDKKKQLICVDWWAYVKFWLTPCIHPHTNQPTRHFCARCTSSISLGRNSELLGRATPVTCVPRAYHHRTTYRMSRKSSSNLQCRSTRRKVFCSAVCKPLINHNDRYC